VRRSWRWLGAACLVLFPLLFIVFGGTDIHPGPSGTTEEQIRLVAAAEARWQLVHLVLAGASLLGIGAVVTVWMMAVRGRSGVLAWVGDLGLVLGVAGAALLSGVVLMEAGLVAPLAVACARSPACLGPEGASVAEAIAGLGWNNVDPLTWAGGPLATGLLLLGLAGGLLPTRGGHRPGRPPAALRRRPARAGEHGPRASSCWGSHGGGWTCHPHRRLCGSDDDGIHWSRGRGLTWR